MFAVLKYVVILGLVARQWMLPWQPDYGPIVGVGLMLPPKYEVERPPSNELLHFLIEYVM